MFLNLFDECVSIIGRWNPKKEYSKETEYRDDLMNFLNSELNKPTMFGNRNIQLVKEASRSLCDIGVGNRKVGIELKKI